MGLRVECSTPDEFLLELQTSVEDENVDELIVRTTVVKNRQDEGNRINVFVVAGFMFLDEFLVEMVYQCEGWDESTPSYKISDGSDEAARVIASLNEAVKATPKTSLRSGRYVVE